MLCVFNVLYLLQQFWMQNDTGISFHFQADTMNLTDMPYLIVGR